MGWGLWASPAPSGGKDDGTSETQWTNNPPTPERQNITFIETAKPVRIPTPIAVPKATKANHLSWSDSLSATDWQRFTEPRTFVPPLLAVSFAFGFWQFYRSYLRRIPGTGYIKPGFFRTRSLLGKVTSVGDGDNFHLFHTPGGRLAGWGWLRRVPTAKKELKARTIPVRIAGIDAPECAHFGRPAQPFSAEALAWLRTYLLGRRVRAYIYRRDQYDRVVASVYVRRAPFFLRKDVGLEMLRAGLATTYEAKTGAEFGGPEMEIVYKAAEATAKKNKRGMWSKQAGGFFGFGKKDLESPRAYKERMKI
ncbi:nuclease domain-containing protein [Podospora appendiculata]|uniref:Probable endonuclease LCL3 n=1 Tax=Podospora appendiculata TaxID=314037 RepID=A0AAE1CHP7_9PEZI|nr:nuclease domain-containing protein [Podospora appendiculata]